MKELGMLIGGIIAMIISAIVNGFVMMKLWNWLIITVFDLPKLGLIQSIGLLLLISFLTVGKPKNNQNDFWSELREKIIFIITHASLCLLLGWIIYLIMQN